MLSNIFKIDEFKIPKFMKKCYWSILATYMLLFELNPVIKLICC